MRIRYLLTGALWLLMLAALVSLGFWQLERAEQKEQRLQLINELRNQSPVRLTELEQWQRFKKVRLSGSWLNGDYLLDNQIWQGRVGYHWLKFLQLPDEQLVLVNLGWLPSPTHRSELPALPTLSGQSEWRGHLYPLAEQAALDRAPVVEQFDEQRTRISHLHPDIWQGKIPAKKLLTYLVRLEGDNPPQTKKDWQFTNMPAAKHIAYAVQWFGLASVLIVLTFFWLKKIRQGKVGQ